MYSSLSYIVIALLSQQLNSMTFQVFHDLYEPCYQSLIIHELGLAL